MDLNHKISDRIISLMKERGISRETLAKSIKADKFKLDNYLQKKAKWDINYLAAACVFLHLSLDDLIQHSFTKNSNSINYKHPA